MHITNKNIPYTCKYKFLSKNSNFFFFQTFQINFMLFRKYFLKLHYIHHQGYKIRKVYYSHGDCIASIASRYFNQSLIFEKCNLHSISISKYRSDAIAWRDCTREYGSCNSSVKSAEAMRRAGKLCTQRQIYHINYLLLQVLIY